MGRASHLFPITVIALALGLIASIRSVRGNDSVTVQVSVDASEFFGNRLTYQWSATDGHIDDQNSPTTNWTLQNGPRIHFAYVLVSNGKGRFAVDYRKRFGESPSETLRRQRIITPLIITPTRSGRLRASGEDQLPGSC